jgi:tetratricopeptide (TPR) repeat protein
MLPDNVKHVSEAVRERFIGRRQALDAFYQRFAYRHMKNAVYYYAEGGVGKTWILRKILSDNLEDPTRTVTDIIDFFDTRNQSIRGLQTTIKAHLMPVTGSQVFEPYDSVIARLDAARVGAQAKRTGLLANMEARANKLFIECCQKAIVGREVIMLFDTFERVQQRYVGQWLLKEFLRQVRGLIVAIAGRPEPHPAPAPDNVAPYELRGLELVDVRAYVHRNFPLSIPDEIVQRIWKHTHGTPLLVDLIVDSPGLVEDEKRLDRVSRIEERKRLERELIQPFVHLQELDRILLAMAFLKRRFDIPMLKHIVASEEILDLAPSEYEGVVEQLRNYKFVKEYPDLESHLLHDEMQKIIEKYFLEELDPRWEIRNSLYTIIVQDYYLDAIRQAKQRQELALARQLEAEQLGYILDKGLKDKNLIPGLAVYQRYRDEIDTSHEFEFEELLWGEVREHLDAVDDKGYQIASDRGQWLRRHGLFPKAEQHFQEMLRRFSEHVVDINKSLGFAQLRQGKVQDAIATFERGRSLVGADDVREIADFENLLGQANRAAGRWAKALEHYTLAARAFTLVQDILGLSGVYVNRGLLYALQGLYKDAIEECNRAVSILGPLPDDHKEAQNKLRFAYMNLGTAYRHASDYDMASQHYQLSLDMARRAQDQEVLGYALQQLGINACLQGRRLRQEALHPAQAADHQSQAWEYLIQGLEIAREANWRPALASGLNRLARVYEEIEHLEQLSGHLEPPDPAFVAVLQKLQTKALSFNPSTDIEYQHNLLIRTPFVELDTWLERSARLFELSALAADEANDYHRALDSLMEFARLLVALKRYDLAQVVVRRTERIKGYDYQEELFAAMSDITLAEIDFAQGVYDLAIEKYATAFAVLAKQTGYASYLLADRLKVLEQRLQTLSSAMRLHWCDYLEAQWLERSVSTVRPDMLRLLEGIRFDAMMRQ